MGEDIYFLILHRTFTTPVDMRNSIIFSLSVSSICFFIFLLLKPFNSNEYIHNWHLFLPASTLSIFISILAGFSALHFLSKIYPLKAKTKENEYLFILLLDLAVIPFLMLLFSSTLHFFFLSEHHSTYRLCYKLLCNILFLEFVLFIPEVFVLKYYKKEDELRELRELNIKLSSLSEDKDNTLLYGTSPKEEEMVIKGEYKDSYLEVNPNNITHIEAMANVFCHATFKQEGK